MNFIKKYKITFIGILLGGIAVCAVTYLAAKFFCSLFSVQAAAVIEAAAAANDGKLVKQAGAVTP
mgnify:CR=1 FL=1